MRSIARSRPNISVSRAKAVQAILDARLKEIPGSRKESGKLPTSFELLEFKEGEGRSSDCEISSHLFQPRWKRLLKAASAHLADLIEGSTEPKQLAGAESAAEAGLLSDTFTCRDAVGGGTMEDVTRLLESFLESLKLADRETGFTILFAYKVWLLPELPWSGATWRTLLITGTLIGSERVMESNRDRAQAKSRLLRHAGHWCTASCVERAVEVLKSMPSFVALDMGRSAMAKLYFELRDDALAMSPANSDHVSGYEWSPGGSAYDDDRSQQLQIAVAKQQSDLSGGLTDQMFHISASSKATSSQDDSFNQAERIWRQNRNIVSL